MTNIVEQDRSGRLARVPFARKASAYPAVPHPSAPAVSMGLLADLVENSLRWLFVVFAVPLVILLAIITPPFQVADELAHLQRADEIGHGEIISERLGGTIDGGWIELGSLYQAMPFHPEVKESVAQATEAGGVG